MNEAKRKTKSIYLFYLQEMRRLGSENTKRMMELEKYGNKKKEKINEEERQ